jgi:hemolysin III
MANPPAAPATEVEQFSLRLFLVTVVTTLAALFISVRFLTPGAWAEQFHHPVWSIVIAFCTISLVNSFFEFFFHRYVLHMPAVPFLRRLYRQHTLHHALTRIARKPSANGRGLLYVENKYPMIEPEQGEASFFPWYSLAIFALALTPLLALLQWVLPSYPWLLAGYSALSVSIILYELLHALNHWPIETWTPLIEHKQWGWFWRPAYAFHLRHHAVIDCNESISGFFGLPIPDWAFRTCVIPKTVYADGEEWSPDKFVSPQPVWFIRWLDEAASGVVQRRRAAASDSAAETSALPLRPYTTGEKIANWVTHGLGLALSIIGLTLLIVSSSLRGDAWHVVSFTVFGLTLLTLYTLSTLHHARRGARSSGFFRKFNRAAVFLLIAGTYTPFLLTNLRGPWGWSLFGIFWGLCGAGAVFHLVFGERLRVTTGLAYLFVGWSIVVALKPLSAAIPGGGMVLLLAGGLCYLIGLLFYKGRHLRYGHALWHTFVLGGSTCHLLAVLLFLLPHPTA